MQFGRKLVVSRVYIEFSFYKGLFFTYQLKQPTKLMILKQTENKSFTIFCHNYYFLTGNVQH